MRAVFAGAVFLWATFSVQRAACGGQETGDGGERFKADRFCVSFWVDPPADANMDARYAELAEANFTVVLGGFGAKTPEQIDRQVRLSEKYGMAAIVPCAGIEPNKLPNEKGCWGYMLRDEPNAGDFPKLAERVKSIRAARPGKLAFINLFPNYASAKQLGTDGYEEYVRRFAEEVDVDVLCMDYYPPFKPDVDGREGYRSNLEVMRRVALERGIPFWNFFYTMPFGNRDDPTEAQIRWQIWTSLAYGAKGVLYFCYWTPRGREFPMGGGIITAEGRRTRHYDQARRINAQLKNLGPALMKLTSTGVYRIGRGANSEVELAGTPIKSISDGDYLIGVFRHAEGRRAVMINNWRFAYTSWPTVVFDAEGGKVMEVSIETGRECEVVDDSPDMEGLQLSLDAGMGRLFLLP